MFCTANQITSLNHDTSSHHKNQITIKTTGKQAYELLLLLSGLQVVFKPHPTLKSSSSTFDPAADDPWAAIKAAKTREERKALFAQMQADHKKALDEKRRLKEEGVE